MATDNSSSSTMAPTGPWRRHSYPSTSPLLSLEADSVSTSPSAEITSDETKYYPVTDDDGTRRPGLWRRRTLVFEMPPAAAAVEQEHHGNCFSHGDYVAKLLGGIGNLPSESA
jgi:hypothetical protein